MTFTSKCPYPRFCYYTAIYGTSTVLVIDVYTKKIIVVTENWRTNSVLLGYCFVCWRSLFFVFGLGLETCMYVTKEGQNV